MQTNPFGIRPTSYVPPSVMLYGMGGKNSKKCRDMLIFPYLLFPIFFKWESCVEIWNLINFVYIDIVVPFHFFFPGGIEIDEG